MSLSAWLLTIPQWLSVLLVLGLFVACGVGLVLLVRRPTGLLQSSGKAS